MEFGDRIRIEPGKRKGPLTGTPPGRFLDRCEERARGEHTLLESNAGRRVPGRERRVLPFCGVFPRVCHPSRGVFCVLKRGSLGGSLIRMEYGDRITIEPGKRRGKPCIRELRITVQDVLEYLASGMTPEEIVKDFPDLTIEDIRACLAFAADRERRLMILPR